jgi:hypothetical protein
MIFTNLFDDLVDCAIRSRDTSDIAIISLIASALGAPTPILTFPHWGKGQISSPH